MKDTTKACLIWVGIQTLLLFFGVIAYKESGILLALIPFFMSMISCCNAVNDNEICNDGMQVRLGPFWQIRVRNKNCPEDFENF